MSNNIDISLLGGFDVTLNGEVVTQFGSDTARALLVYLALHPGTTFRRDTLAALLWPEQNDSDARRNLRVTLSRLRDALSDRDVDQPCLNITRATIQAVVQPHCLVDVNTLRTTVMTIKSHHHEDGYLCDDCASQLRQAVDLYQDELMTGFSLDSAPFEEWMMLERENLHWEALECLYALADYYQHADDYEQALACARRQVELEPWREVAHRQCMLALVMSDRRNAALAQYEACRAILNAELGVEPEAETSRLFERIRDGEITVPEAETSPVSSVAENVPVIVETTPLQNFPEGERRIVTVLYVAVDTGDADVEARMEMFGLALRNTSDQVQRFGGEIIHYDESGITAIYGSQKAWEDDPERAVLTAFSIQKLLGSGEGKVPVHMGVDHRDAPP